MTGPRLASPLLLALACGEPTALPEVATTGAAESTGTEPTTGVAGTTVFEDFDPGPPPPSCDVEGQGGHLGWSLLQDALPGEIMALAATPDGHVVVTGTALDHHADAYVQVRDRTGALIWSDLYVGTHGLDDIPLDVTVDDEGFIHVLVLETIAEIFTGDYVESTERLVVLRYAPDGTHVWRLERPSVGPDSPTGAYGSLASFANTTILIEGIGNGSSSFREQLLTLDRLGNIQSTALFDLPGYGRHAIGADGSHCFAGESHSGGEGVFVRCYTADGVMRWSRFEWSTDRVVAFVMGRAGEVYLGRLNYASGTFRLLRYDRDGVLAWYRSLPSFGPGASDFDVAVRCDGSLLLIGSMDEKTSNGSTVQPWVARYDTQGDLLWSFQHEFGPPDHIAYGHRIIGTPSGDAVIIADYPLHYENYTTWGTWLAYVSD